MLVEQPRWSNRLAAAEPTRRPDRGTRRATRGPRVRLIPIWSLAPRNRLIPCSTGSPGGWGAGRSKAERAAVPKVTHGAVVTIEIYSIEQH